MPFWSWMPTARPAGPRGSADRGLRGSSRLCSLCGTSQAPGTFGVRIGYDLFRIAHRLLTGIPVRVGNFSIIPFIILKRLTCMPELWNHFAGAVYKSRAPFECLPMDRGRRLSGQSHMDLASLVAHGLGGIGTFHAMAATRILISTAICLVLISGRFRGSRGPPYDQLGRCGLGNVHHGFDSAISGTTCCRSVQPRIYADLESEQHAICAEPRLFRVCGQGRLFMTRGDACVSRSGIRYLRSRVALEGILASRIRPWIRGDVLEVGAGLGANTAFLQNSDVCSWHCVEPDPGLAGR